MSKFIGIYSGNLPQESVAELESKAERQNWYVWLEEEKNSYIMQPLNAAFRPDGRAQRVDAKEFGLYFWEAQSHPLQAPEVDEDVEREKSTQVSSVRIHEYKKEASAAPVLTPPPVQLKPAPVTTTSAPVTTTSAPVNITPASIKPPTMVSPFDHEAIDDFLLSTLPVPEGTNRYANLDEAMFANLPLEELEEAKELDMTMRDEFANSMEFWNSGKKRKAKELFRELLDQDNDYCLLHKHLFTDLSIELRRIKQYDLALEYAIKCFELSPRDSNACFNVARMYFEASKYREAKYHLDLCLEMEETFPLARQFRAIVQQYIIRYKLWEKK